MAIQTEPTRIQIPFADSGTKNVIPDTNSTPSASQAASWTDGFPAQCSLPLSAGGIPPARADFNGIFNTMSQSLRFGQEGGTWEWDATVDYAANRMVLGSDGLLYWSVAQSGPNVGGAQDPTADDGTYWQSPYAKTMPTTDKSSAIATTQWVRDAMESSPLYVDPVYGSDSNDGLSSGNALKTIAKSLSLAEKTAGSSHTINLLPGVYAEDVVVSEAKILFILQGNVSVGSLTASSGAQVNFSGQSHTLTIQKSGDSAISVTRGSRVYADCDISLTCSDTNVAVSVYYNSSLSLESTLSATTTNVSRFLSVFYSSVAIFFKHTTISSSSISECAYIDIGSCACFLLGITTPQNVTGTCITSGSGSLVQFAGSSDIYGASCLHATIGSTFSFIQLGSVSFYATGSGSSRCIVIENSSNIYFARTASGSPALSFNAANSIGNFFEITSNSWCSLLSPSAYFSGTVTGSTVSCIENSTFILSASTTITGSVTGKRYSVNRCGCISTNGGGANRIPGSTAGTADSSQYGMYA